MDFNIFFPGAGWSPLTPQRRPGGKVELEPLPEQGGVHLTPGRELEGDLKLKFLPGRVENINTNQRTRWRCGVGTFTGP